jgi:dihydroorotate dehydrogenase electron transfer subunit
MFQVKAKVINNKRVDINSFYCFIRARQIARAAHPGQFVSIRLNDGVIPLLRRPLSIHSVRGENIGLLYEVLGAGTAILSGKKAGEDLDIIGPLGKGFNYGPRRPSVPACPAGRRGPQDLVAGGLGVAPLLFLAEKLVHGVHQSLPVRQAGAAHSRPIILIGAKTKKHILCKKEFEKLGCIVKIATDDGSKGFKGKVTELLKQCLSSVDREPSSICACGPRPMLREISRISKKRRIPAQISLEEHMACGIGACFGCVVNTREGFKRVCKDGPVFKAEEIIWK